MTAVYGVACNMRHLLHGRLWQELSIVMRLQEFGEGRSEKEFRTLHEEVEYLFRILAEFGSLCHQRVR